MLIIIVLESEYKPIQSLSGEMTGYPRINLPGLYFHLLFNHDNVVRIFIAIHLFWGLSDNLCKLFWQVFAWEWG